jgi:hypothetical protein
MRTHGQMSRFALCGCIAVFALTLTAPSRGAEQQTLVDSNRVKISDDDRLLRHFYDANVPPTIEQLEQYARTHIDVNAALAPEYKYTAPAVNLSPLEILANEERQLALAERRSAMMISSARLYLNAAQLAVLFAQLDQRPARLREQLTTMRVNIVAGKNPNDGLGIDESWPVPGSARAQPTAEQIAATRRKAFLGECRQRLATALGFLKLDATGAERLCVTILEPHMANLQARLEAKTPGRISPNNFVPGISQAVVKRKFGAEFATRWTQYENMCDGLGFVDSELVTFYNGGSPLTTTQRFRLATTYQKQKQAEVPEPFIPTGLSPETMMKYVAERSQRQLPIVERTNAAIVTEAGAYLDQRQIEVLSAVFARQVSVMRQSARAMIENSAGNRN